MINPRLLLALQIGCGFLMIVGLLLR